MIDYKVTSEGVAVLTWNMKDRPVNVMNDESLALFSDLIEKAFADGFVKGLVIASAKRDFVTGADLVSFLSDRRPEVIQQKGRYTQVLLRRLETGGKPVCAALTGSALGGGMEIALACHRRIAADKPGLRVGLPEVTLGLLPGAGGTQRLPRLIGVRAALPYLLQGRTVAAADALKAGMLHEVVPEAEVVERAIAWVAAQAEPVTQPWDRKGYVLPDGPLDPVAIYQVFAQETARITARTQNNQPAPRHILSSVFEGCVTDIDTGLKSELRHFVACVCSVESKNIIRTSFFGVTDMAKLKRRPAGVAELAIESLGAVGSLEEVRPLVAAAVAAQLPVRWQDTAGEGTIPVDWQGRVEPVRDATGLDGCQVVVVAGGAAAPETGATLVIRLWPQGGCSLQGGVGLRIVPDVRLAEVIRDAETPPSAVAHAMDLARRLGKVPLVVKAQRGTYVERVTGAYQREVERLRAQGVPPVFIDNAARQAGMQAAPCNAAVGDEPPRRTTPADWAAAAEAVARLKEQLLLVQAEEALRCLDEGVIDAPIDADVGALLGWGFPVHLGGPIGYVDTIGIDRFLERYEATAPARELDAGVRKQLRAQAGLGRSFHGD